jgi:sarcosine oxidase subunit gamma
MLTAGVKVVDRSGLGLATVLARKGKSAALAARVRERFGVELPTEPRRAMVKIDTTVRTAAGSHAPADSIAFAGTAPGAWLAMREDAGADFASSLAEALEGLASVSDQSDGLAVVRISGLNVRDTLCKVVPVDLHPRAFAINQVAVTLVAHMPVTMWRLADDADGSAVFEIGTFRSFADSFAHAMSESAAEFGLLR